MKPDPDLKSDGAGVRAAGRRAANHCAALLGEVPVAADTGALIDDFGQGFAAALKAPLAELMGGAKLKLTYAAQTRIDASICVTKQEPLAAHFVLGEAASSRALVATIGGASALSLCDRSFGGTGDVADPLPDRLPMSADLTLGRLGGCLAGAVSQALHGADIAVKARGEKLEKLVPFGRIAECIALEISIEDGERDAWSIRLLGEAKALGDWLAECDRKATTDSDVAAAPSAKTYHDTGPLYEIPLPVTAVLAECALPLARVSRLRAGDIIPLSIRREVPLTVGVSEVARGTVGTVDDRVALQISRISSKGNQS